METTALTAAQQRVSIARTGRVQSLGVPVRPIIPARSHVACTSKPSRSVACGAQAGPKPQPGFVFSTATLQNNIVAIEPEILKPASTTAKMVGGRLRHLSEMSCRDGQGIPPLPETGAALHRGDCSSSARRQRRIHVCNCHSESPPPCPTSRLAFWPLPPRRRPWTATRPPPGSPTP